MDPSILSEELLEAMGGSYGQDPAADLVLSGATTNKQRQRDERKRQRDAEPSEEVKEEVKKLSKKQEKRIAQIQKRKDRESKRDQYLETINKHEISASDRQLLTSSKQLNQTLTLKQTLSHLLKKERAGIALTDEEKRLLYPNKSSSSHKDEVNFDDVLMSTEQYEALKAYEKEREEKRLLRKQKKSSKGVEGSDSEESSSMPPPPPPPLTPAAASTKKPQTNSGNPAGSSTTNVQAVQPSPAPTGETMFSLDDLFATIKPSNKANNDSVDAEVNQDKKKKKKKKKKSTQQEEDNPEEDDQDGKDQIATDKMDVVEEENVTEEEPKLKKQKKTLTKEEQTSTGSSSTSSSVGKNLLSQLLQLKGKSKSAAIASEETKETKSLFSTIPEDTEKLSNQFIEQDESEEQKGPIYKVEEINMPVSDLGIVHVEEGSLHVLPPVVRTTKVITVPRPSQVVAERMNLPVCRMEQEIVEAVQQNDVIILCGETGSGKSTQVPQFLYESGYAEEGYIGVTQPRRVAVTSTAERVNYEMGEINKDGEVIRKQKKRNREDVQEGRLVGYQIRYDASTIGSRTKIKFMTDGILLREVTNDILLRNYSVIILDEAHERNVNTDILLGMISRAIPLRKKIAAQEMKKWNKLTPEQRLNYAEPLKPLKLIIMSATIRVEDFQNPILFPSPPPLIHVEARQYPVVSHFAKRTELQHYLKETHRKVCQIHRKLPAGGILVFLTGKREILYMCHKLQRSLGSQGKKKSTTHSTEGEGDAMNGVEEDLTQGEDDKEEGDEYRKYSSLGNHDQAEIDSDEDIDKDDQIDSDDEDDNEGGEDDLNATNDEYAPKNDDTLTTNTNNTTSSEETQEDPNSIRNQMLAQILGTSTTTSMTTTAEVVNDTKASTDAVAKDSQDATTSVPNTTTSPEEESLPMLKPLIRPLYAMMPAHLQAQIFAPVPPGYRLIVVATNVAETSITIPNITYVVDCGRCKEKVMSSGSTSGGGIARYEIKWISKASADQRQGRAGRTGPGHCYRLYSSNFYHEHMLKFLPPEITLTPLEDVVLQMKALGITEIESFPFPTMPPTQSLKNAITLLTNLGAVVPKAADKSAMGAYNAMLDKVLNSKEVDDALAGKLSEMGRLMAHFPLHPRFAKIMIIAARFTQLPKDQLSKFMGYVLTLVATIAERSVFMHDEASGSVRDSEVVKEEKDSDKEDSEEDEEHDSDDDEDDNKHKGNKGTTKLFYHPNGDVMARLRATGAYTYSVYQVCQQKRQSRKSRPKEANSDEEIDDESSTHEDTKFRRKELQDAANDESIGELCDKNFLHLPSLQRVVDLRSQLQSICESLFPTLNLSDSMDHAHALDAPLEPPSQSEEHALRQVLLSGYCDSIARKAPIGIIKEGSRRKRLTAYFSCNPAITEPLYIHPQSNLFHTDPSASLPEFIVYGSLIRNQKGDTLYMSNLSVVSPTWISSIARDCPLLSWGSPLQSPSPSYDLSLDCVMCHVVPKYGIQQWTLPAVKRPIEELVPVVKKADSTSSSLTPLGHRPGDEVYRWFARFLLEGAIGLRIKGTLSKDKCKEATTVITQNKVHPQITSLLRALVVNEVRTRAALLSQLRKDPKYLYEEIQALLHVEYRKDFRQAWSQLKG